jgi:hypothetical protein
MQGDADPRAGRTLRGIALATLLLAAAVTGPTLLAGEATGAAEDPVLTVEVTGDGTVTSDDGAISCPGKCSASQPQGAQVTLRAVPAADERFQAWGDDCEGNDKTSCGLVMDEDKEASASFSGTAPSPSPSPTPSAAPTPSPSPSPAAQPTPSPEPALTATPSPGPAAAATPTPGPSKGPSVAISAAAVQSLARQAGRVRLRLKCPVICRLRLRGTVSIAGGASAVYRIPATTRTLARNRTVTVRLRLSRAARAAIRARATAKRPALARITIVARRPSGGPQRTTVKRIRITP